MKKIIGLSSILAILFSQTGCIGDNSHSEKTVEAEKTLQKQGNISSQKEDTAMITLTNNETGQEIEIPLEEFKNMSRKEFAKKFNIPEEEVNQVSDEEFEKQKQAMIEMFSDTDEFMDEFGKRMANALEQFGETMEKLNQKSQETTDTADFSTTNKPYQKSPVLTSEEQKELQNQLVKMCSLGKINNVQALLDKGADINIPDSFGDVPLKKAIWSDNPELVKLLLQQGAKVDAKLLTFAQNRQNIEIINLLKAYQAKE